MVDFIFHYKLKSAQVIGFQDGNAKSEKFLLMRSPHSKPVIRAVYYTNRQLSIRIGRIFFSSQDFDCK